MHVFVPIPTYIDEVLGVEHVRNLVSQEILLRPAQALDVDMLDHHLQHTDRTRPNMFTPSTEEPLQW